MMVLEIGSLKLRTAIRISLKTFEITLSFYVFEKKHFFTMRERCFRNRKPLEVHRSEWSQLALWFCCITVTSY